jgi:hypothetical protein
LPLAQAAEADPRPVGPARRHPLIGAGAADPHKQLAAIEARSYPNRSFASNKAGTRRG